MKADYKLSQLLLKPLCTCPHNCAIVGKSFVHAKFTWCRESAGGQFATRPGSTRQISAQGEANFPPKQWQQEDKLSTTAPLTG